MENLLHSTSATAHGANFHEWEVERHVFKHSAGGYRKALTSQGVGWSVQRRLETGGRRWGFQELEGVWTCLLKGIERHGVYILGTIMQKSKKKKKKNNKMPHVTSHFGIETVYQIGWVDVSLRISTPKRTGSSDGQLQLKEPLQERTHCRDTATWIVSWWFILFSLFHLKKVVDNCFCVERQATAFPKKVACRGAQRLGKLPFS